MKDKIVIIVGVIFLILIILNLALAVYVYKQYTDNMNAINQQNWLTKVKLETLEKSGESFKESIESFKSQIKNYDDGFVKMESRINSSETTTRDVAAKMQSIKLDIEDWQKKYSMAVTQIAELKEKTDALMSNISQFNKDSSGNVDLGKIAVQGDSGR